MLKSINAIRGRLDSFRKKNTLRVKNKKNWSQSQDYEFENAVLFMKSQYYKDLLNELATGKQQISDGYINEVILKEFFDDSVKEWNYFVDHIRGRKCLDIGPCTLSPLSGMAGTYWLSKQIRNGGPLIACVIPQDLV